MLLSVFVLILSLILSVFIYRYPLQAIRLQQRFYACINWRMEPISMDKEIRNTKLMGLFLLVVTVLIGLYRVLSTHSDIP